MEIHNEKNKKEENIEKNINLSVFHDNIILNLNKIKDIIKSLCTNNNKNYSGVIDCLELMNKINHNINNFYEKINYNNKCFNVENKIKKYSTKIKRNFKCFYKTLYFSDNSNNFNNNKLDLIKNKIKKDFCIIINSIFILKQYINENKHLELQKYLKVLVYFQYIDIISLNEFKFILEFYINIFKDLIIIKTHYLSFIEDLIEAMINNPYINKQNNSNDIYIFLINLFEEYFVNNYEMKIKISKSNIWLKLLSNKIINNEGVQDTSEIISNKIYKFLVDIYKYNLNTNMLFEDLYKQSAIDLNYYLNSIKFLSSLFKEEELSKKDYFNFYIKNGFYIPENNPLILEKIKFKENENEFSVIFSFRILNNSKEEKIVFNLSNVNGNIILKFIVNKDKTVKIVHENKEWNIPNLTILENKDYLICLTQSYSSFKSTKLLFFINKINTNKRKKNSANQNVFIKADNIIEYESYDNQSPYPYFDSEMILELGKSNFNGIIGDFIIINKKINESDIHYLYNLNGNYSYIVENNNNKYDLIYKNESFYTDSKDSLNFFQKLNFDTILNILSYKLDNKFVKDKKELKIENFGILKYKANNIKIKTINFKYSINVFFNKNGIEFLLFQLHNISNIINDDKTENFNLFNIYLYHTLKLFYEIISTIDDDISEKKKNDSLKFSYFIVSLMVILYKIKKKENNIKLDNKIYDLLLKYIDFYSLHNYYDHKNLILSLLLDDSLFKQNEILKEETIIIYLMDMIQNNLNKEENIINKEILYKILNLDFILDSKEYRHKLYMKLIISLLLIKNNKMIYDNIIKNIIYNKNEIKLYHYLKHIYIKFDDLKPLLMNDKKFISFIKAYSKKETNYFHCKYCFNILFLIYQLKQELLKDKVKIDENINLNIAIKNKEFLISYKISLLKTKFINCFNMNNDIKLKFIKNYKYIFSSGDNNSSYIKNRNSNNSIIHIESNLILLLNTSKILENFDSLINDLYLIYNNCEENIRNYKLIETNECIISNNKEKDQINNVFQIMQFFLQELIIYYKKEKNIEDKNQLNFLNQFLNLEGIETFFRIYLRYDYNSSIEILQEIIALSINRIKHPFYFNYIEIDEIIDKFNKENNEKIKDNLIEKIIVEINKICVNDEIINSNRKTLLLIINEIEQNAMKLKDNVEKCILSFLENLVEKKFFNNKILYKNNGEYNNLLELSLDLLFDLLKKNDYDKKYNDFLYNFVINEKNSTSIFHSIDEDLIKKYQNKDKKNNKKKEKDSNILYCIYFLIYFIEMKNKLSSSFKESDIPIIKINGILSIIFYNAKLIFKLINNKKSLKHYGLKSNNPSLDTYYSLFNFFAENIKKVFPFEDLKLFYEENKLKPKGLKEQKKKRKKSSFFKENIDDNISSSIENKENNFILETYCGDNQNEDLLSGIIIDNYILIDNKSDNIKNKFLHNTISSFRMKNDSEFKHYSNNIFKEKENQKDDNSVGSEKENKEKNNNDINEIENNSDSSSEEELNELNKNIKDDNKVKSDEDNNTEYTNDFEIENIRIASVNDLSKNIQNNTTIMYSKTNIAFSNTSSIIENEINNNNTMSNNIPNKKDFNVKKLLDKINIPVFYYKKLIDYNQLYFTKILINPKANYLWKIFTYTFRDISFNNTNFQKLSKCFKIFSKNYKIEMSQKENNYYLNYPTKVKNFICNDYYRPFLKPDMKFFNRELIYKSHNYIPKKSIEKARKEDKLSRIKFIKFLPIDEKEKHLERFYCENVSYKGSIFGKMYVFDSFLIFVSKTYRNFKKNNKSIMFFLYSKEDINKYKNIKKIIIFYFNEIKEIILRRFCLKNIGYEIFLKDGRSYLFNFFQSKEIDKFTNLILSKNKDIIINDPVNYFEKKEYKLKFKKGEINNFQYLLLVNKFATRTYNNTSQYLVFPIIYMDLKNNISRDLSKAVCLNKEESEVDLIKHLQNFKVMKCYFNNHYSTSAYILYYLVRLTPYTYLQIDFQSGKFDVPERIFSSYKNYNLALVTSNENREIIPEFFHNYEFCINLNYNFIGKMQGSKKLIHNFNSNKFKCSVEFIINHRKILDNLNIVPWINNIFGCNQTNDSKEIMNIFPLYSYEQFNDFDKEVNTLKEKFKDSENKYLEIYYEIRNSIALLDLGISPIQLFKSPHPERPQISNNSNLMIDLNSSIKNTSKNTSGLLNISSNSCNESMKKTEQKAEKKNKKEKMIESFATIEKFILKQKSQKYKILVNNQTMSIFFIFKRTIIIYNIYNLLKPKTFLYGEPNIVYPVEIKLNNNLVEIDSTSSKNICCELMKGFYCICRNDDKTLKFINYNGKNNFSYLWLCIITSIEIYSRKIINTNYYTDYKYKLFLGDEEGNLCIICSDFRYILNNSEIKMVDVKATKKIKIHKNYINNILFNERLNIVISSSYNGDIGINNAYSLETLNFIQIGKNYSINIIKVSFYDLLYINCYNYINKNYYLKCYTLNGMKVTKLKSKNKIINFFINENVNIFYENKTFDKYSLYDFTNKISSDKYDNNRNKSINLWENEIPVKEDYYSDDEKDIYQEFDNENDASKLVHCNYCNKIKKLFNIYDNNQMSLEKL